MNLVGVFAIIDDTVFDDTLTEVNSLCGVAVDFKDPSSGTVLLTISGSSRNEQKIIFDKLKALPFVINAEIVYFYRSDDEQMNQSPATPYDDFRSIQSLFSTFH